MAKKLVASDYPIGTRTQTLDRTYIHKGVIYEAGEATVPDSFPTPEELAQRQRSAMEPMELGRTKLKEPADDDNAE